MKKSLIESILEIKELVRVGNLVRAQSCLKIIQIKKITRPERLSLAELARRLGDPLRSIRLLNPVVRSSLRTKVKPTPQEEATYASALLKIGAITEAESILRKLNPKIVPETLLFQSHALFTQWRYEEAIPLLQTYLSLVKDEYQAVVGRVNLAAALVQGGRHRESDPLLAQLLRETKAQAFAGFQGNTLEILAQQAIQLGKWREAELHLKDAHGLLAKAGGLDEFFVRKWMTVLALLKEPRNSTAVANLKRLRMEAQKKQHWETIRECDRFLAVATGDEELLLKVYFGSPFPSYREKLLSEFPGSISLPETYPWTRGDKKNPKRLRFLRGEGLGKHPRLKVGQLKHRLAHLLVSDFYRPFRVASLYAGLYPDQFFHPVGAPTRVHQAVKEFRIWLMQTELPLTLREESGAYQFVITRNDYALEIPSSEPGSNSIDREEPLRRAALDSHFSALQASKWLQMPRRTAFHLLERLKAAGHIEKHGQGPNTRYRFLKTNHTNRA